MRLATNDKKHSTTLLFLSVPALPLVSLEDWSEVGSRLSQMGDPDTRRRLAGVQRASWGAER